MSKQLLHLVFGGELTNLSAVEFKDLSKVHFVGVYPNYAKARDAWKAAAQATVDNAHMRYFVVHLHRLLQPDELAGTPVALAKSGALAKKTGAKSSGKPAKRPKRK